MFWRLQAEFQYLIVLRASGLKATSAEKVILLEDTFSALLGFK